MTSQAKILLCLLVIGVLSLAGSAKKPSCKAELKKIVKKNLTNGRVVILKQSLIYSCKDGYKLIGNKKRSCNKRNGRISGKVPECVRNVSCGIPFLANGNFTGKDFTVNGRIIYKCNHGFKMVGDKKESKCKKNGKWSNVKPTCQRIQCPALTKLMKGNVTSTDPNYSVGTKLYFECDDNYEMSGPDTLTCMENGEWDRRRPYCKAIRCPDPGQIPNGLVHGRDFRIGKKLRFTCYGGYKLHGSKERTCLKNRRWEGSLAVCDDGNSHCPTLGTPIKGEKQGNQYNQGDIVTFSCEDGYVLRGSAARVCMQDGQWNGTEAFCIDEQQARYKNQNETALLLKENFLDTVMEYTCTDDNSTCNQTFPEIDARARQIDINAERGLELVFVFDGSSSIKKGDFEIGLKFAQRLVELIGANRRPRLPVARFAAVTYGSTANLEFNLGVAEVDSTEKAVKRIGEIQRVMGGTASALALKMVREVIVPEARDGKRFMVFITDGRSNIGGPPKKEARKLKEQHDFEVYVIGVGDKVNSKELYNIATDDEKHVIEVENYDVIEKGLELALKLPEKDYSPCGVSKTPNRARMVGGSVAGHGMWPWMARVYRIHNGEEKLVCGASLIRRQWVLTAAHCFYSHSSIFKRRISEAGRPKTFNMMLGDHDTNVKEKSEQSIQAEKIFVHESYNDKDFVNDIALVRLNEKAKLSTNVRTLCLPDQDLLIPKKHGFVAGWGVTEVVKPGVPNNGQLPTSTVLRESAFTIQKDSLCLKQTEHYVNPNVTFCAGDGKGGNDTCWGDSGGPFAQEGLVDGKHRWMATGLVSWGEGCGWKDKYGYYTRVLPFVDWINKTITENSVKGDDD